MSRSTIQRTAGAFLLAATVLAPGVLQAQDRASRLRHELGFWFGASNPLPGSDVDAVLDANVGAGGFYRVNWPWIFHSEFGFSWAQYFSRGEQKLLTVPVYGALSYQLPFAFKVNTFLKLGGGGAWIEVRPANRSGWDPLFYAGLEFSILASRRLRVGLRIDYNLIYEKNQDPPPLYYLTLANTDPRFQQTQNFSVQNGEFFHFGLMLSFVL
ncbi:MAG: hypothetical protein K1X75_14605 [Leptospirales bacterium]|nr:hypothetical protein [Leptospirales bacterium]